MAQTLEEYIQDPDTWNNATKHNYSIICIHCNKTWGAHSGPLNNKSYRCRTPNGQNWDEITFIPQINQDGKWIKRDGGLWDGPILISSSKSLGKSTSKAVKIYKHQCPCGLIVCDYHQVES